MNKKPIGGKACKLINLDKKVARTSQYSNIPSVLNTGVTTAQVEFLDNHQLSKQRDEIFSRISSTTLEKILTIQHNTENVCQIDLDNDDIDNNSTGVDQFNITPKHIGNKPTGTGQTKLSLKTSKKQSIEINNETELCLFDLRDRQDFEDCHIKSALHFPSVEIARDKYLAEIHEFKNKPNKLQIMYHHTEKKGAQYAIQQAEKGFENQFYQTGGLVDFITKFPDLCEGRNVEMYLERSPNQNNQIKQRKPVYQQENPIVGEQVGRRIEKMVTESSINYKNPNPRHATSSSINQKRHSNQKIRDYSECSERLPSINRNDDTSLSQAPKKKKTPAPNQNRAKIPLIRGKGNHSPKKGNISQHSKQPTGNSLADQGKRESMVNGVHADYDHMYNVFNNKSAQPNQKPLNKSNSLMDQGKRESTVNGVHADYDHMYNVFNNKSAQPNQKPLNKSNSFVEQGKRESMVNGVHADYDHMYNVFNNKSAQPNQKPLNKSNSFVEQGRRESTINGVHADYDHMYNVFNNKSAQPNQQVSNKSNAGKHSPLRSKQVPNNHIANGVIRDHDHMFNLLNPSNKNINKCVNQNSPYDGAQVRRDSMAEEMTRKDVEYDFQDIPGSDGHVYHGNNNDGKMPVHGQSQKPTEIDYDKIGDKMCYQGRKVPKLTGKP